jgi:hypothetical protein
MRLLAESVVVVASILLAFGIDAWWNELSERELRSATLEGLIADFEGMDRPASGILRRNQKLVASHDLLISLLREGSATGGVALVPDTLLIAAYNIPTYNPPRTSVEMALASGRLTDLDDEPLRRLLALWLQVLDDTAEDDAWVSDIVQREILPLLASTPGLPEVLPSIDDWRRGSVPDSVAHLARPVAATDELMGLLAVRRELTRQVVRGISQLIDIQQDVTAALEASAEGAR